MAAALAVAMAWSALTAVDAQQAQPQAAQASSAAANPNAYASTYKPFPSRTTVIRNATILTAAGPLIERGSVLLQDGKIAAVGQSVNAPADAVTIDASNKWVTPGVIDTHSHLGVYAAPGIESLQDGNEMTSPNTAEVSAEHSIWPQDPQFDLSLAGGVTTMQILPGSANLFGGRGVTVKNVPSRTAEGMKFPGAPYGLKMACGENPKRVYGTQELVAADAHGQRRRLSAAPGSRRSNTARACGGGRRPARIRKSARRVTCSSRRSPASSTARSWCTTIAIAPTRWRR